MLNITGNGVVNMSGVTGIRLVNLGSNSAANATLNLGTGGVAGTLNTDYVVGSSTGVVNFNHTGSYTFAPVIAGSLTVNKLGEGTTTLTGANAYTGGTNVSQGTLVVDGSIDALSLITVDSNATLGGHGILGTITGAGTVAPGNSPGLLTATSIDPGSGLGFTFEFTQVGSPFNGLATNANTVNDVLRLTDLTSPFFSALDSDNIVILDFTGALSLAAGQIYRGGFYADYANGADFLSKVQGANYPWVGLDPGLGVSVSTFRETSEFGTGNFQNGYVTQFTVVPEPSRAQLLIGGVALTMRRRRKA